LTAALTAARREQVIYRAHEIGDAIRRRDALAGACELIEASTSAR
jgi:hypothetical protein